MLNRTGGVARDAADHSERFITDNIELGVSYLFNPTRYVSRARVSTLASFRHACEGSQTPHWLHCLNSIRLPRTGLRPLTRSWRLYRSTRQEQPMPTRAPPRLPLVCACPTRPRGSVRARRADALLTTQGE
jgi:hypothetical protein